MTASDVTSGGERHVAAAAQAPIYPFSAIVGLPDLKLALLLNAVSPAIGGVLVRGEKGTAKSTVVRGLGALLPPVHVVAGCRFSCDPAAPDPACPDGPHPPGGAGAGPARHARRAAGRRDRGPPGRLAGHRARADRRRHGLRARRAGGGAPRPAVRGRGQPAARPSRRPAAGRGRARGQLRRARGDLGPARGPVPARRHDEPGGRRAAAAAAGPVRADRGGRGQPGPGRARRGRPPPPGLRGRPGGVRRPLRRRVQPARRRRGRRA